MTFEDEEECKNALKRVRSDEDESDFVLFGYVNNNPTSSKLKLVGSGTGGIQGIADSVQDESTGTYYGLLRVNDVVVQTMKTVKFVFVIYMGEKVSFFFLFFFFPFLLFFIFYKIKTIQKAKLTTHKGFYYLLTLLLFFY